MRVPELSFTGLATITSYVTTMTLRLAAFSLCAMQMGVISGATADLLGLDGEASELSGEQRAGVEVKLKAMM